MTRLLEVCPSIVSESHDSESIVVDVSNSSEVDLEICPGDDIAFAQFYSGVLCAAGNNVIEQKVEEPVLNSVTRPSACQPPQDACPSMPLRSEPNPRRQGDATVVVYSSCVARLVDRKERAKNAKAMAVEQAHLARLLGLL